MGIERRQRATVTNLLLVGSLGLSLGVAAALFITALRPDKDNTALITIIFGFLATGVTQAYGLLQNADVKAKTDETHAAVNGQVTDFKNSVRDAAHEGVKAAFAAGTAAGTAAGLVAGAAAADARNDALRIQDAGAVPPKPI